MIHLYKEVQPADHFEISLPQILSSSERQIITLFYQPLSGPEAISLYLTLWAEGEDTQNHSLTHYHLMNVLDMSIGKVFEARIALEAIGLLRTYRKDVDSSRSFLYELVRPLDPLDFFQDPLLSMFLFSKIGENAYKKLRDRFNKKTKRDGYKEVSRTFTDVYKPVHSNVFIGQVENVSKGSQDYPFYMENFDFHLLTSGLNEQLVPSSSLTFEARETIAKLAYLYKFTPIDMQKIVILALDDQMEITRDRLKKAASDYYKLTVSTNPPKLTKVFDSNEEGNRINDDQPSKTREQEIIEYFENTNPIDHLRNLNNGKEPTEYTKELVSNLFINNGMGIGVVNVLIEYVMLQTDKKLPKNFVETIADHWNRKNIKTAKEAMALARAEHDKYKKIKNKEYVPKVDQSALEKQTTSTIDNRFAKYEKIIPYDFLKQLNSGKEPFSYTVEIAESLVEKYAMPIGVVNVLMEYAIEQTDGKVSKRFIETIASNWVKLDIQTAEQALQQIEDTVKNKELVRKVGFVPTITKDSMNAVKGEFNEEFYFYETTPPYEFLKDLHHGHEPFPSTVKITEDLVKKYDLSVGVVNVLAEYVLSMQNGKFPKRYVETIASSLRQLGIGSAQAAYEHLSKNKDAVEMKKRVGYVPQVTNEFVQNSLPSNGYLSNEGAYYFKTPYEFLKNLANGSEPIASNVKLAESLVLNLGLPLDVANVLIEYVYQIKSGQLPKKYVETIASNWVHNNIATVQQAKELVKNKVETNEMLRTVGYVPTITEEVIMNSIGNRVIEEEYKFYEFATPYQFLKQMNGGREPFANTIQLAENIVTRFNLPVGVVNVLVEYVLEMKDGKLPRTYVETIADNWSRKNIKTVKEAKEHLELERELFEKRQEDKENRPRSKWGRVEKIPQWFKEQKDQQPSEIQSESIDFEKERLRILEKLGRNGK